MTDGEVTAFGSEAVMEDEKSTSLNFKVSPEFKKQFKGFAVAQGVSMTALLKEGFTLSRKKQKNDRTID